jgi:uncharacterized protein
MANIANSSNLNANATLDPAFDEGLRKHLVRVYSYMTVGLAITGLVAFVVGSTPALYTPLFSSPVVWIVIFLPLVFVVALSASINSISSLAAQAIFWVFCAVIGVSMASVFVLFTGASIARTFFITAAMFGLTTLYGYTTKSDLSKFGSFLVMGLIGVLVAAAVNLFLGSGVLQVVLSAAGIIVFLGLAAWDTQAIKEQYAEGAGTEANQKLAVMGALSLYLSFINLFQLLLTFTGQQRS